MSSQSSVRGKYAAYLEQSGPACCGLSHGFTDWFDSEADLAEYIDSNYPGADWPGSTDEASTKGEEIEDGQNNAAAVGDSEPPLAENPSTGNDIDTINAPLDMSVGLNLDAGADDSDGDEDEEEEDEEEEDEESEEDDISISWAGSFEDLCESPQYQAQVVRVRFFEDLKVDHPDKQVEFSYDDNVPTPSVPEHLRDLFDKWLASGAMAFC
jgi:hypothetical protein